MHYGLLFISISLWGLSCIMCSIRYGTQHGSPLGRLACLVLCAVSGGFYRHGGNPLVGLEAVLNLLEVRIGAHYLFL